jgi:hypothetical protein
MTELCSSVPAWSPTRFASAREELVWKNCLDEHGRELLKICKSNRSGSSADARLGRFFPLSDDADLVLVRKRERQDHGSFACVGGGEF